MKLLIGALLVLTSLTGCSSQDSAYQVWRGYVVGCDRNSFAVTMNASGAERTFSATCTAIK